MTPHPPPPSPRSYRTVLSGFADVVRRQARGEFVVTASGQSHRIVIDHGRPVAVELAADVVPLVKILGQWDNLRDDMDLIRLIVASSSTPAKRREALIASGAVSPARLQEAERQRALQELSFLFGLRTATTTFHEGLTERPETTLPILPAHALLHFARQPQHGGVVRAYVARFADTRLALRPELDLHGLGLDESEQSVAWKLAVEPQTVRNLLASGLPADATQRVMFALALCDGVVRRPEPRDSSPDVVTRSSRVATTPPPLPASDPEPPPVSELPRRNRITPATAFAEAEKALDRGDLRLASAAIARARDIDPGNPSLEAMAIYVDAQLEWPAAPVRESDVPRLAELTRLVDRAPDCALAHGYRGILRGRIGMLPEAIDDLREAVRINPYHAAMRRQLDAVEQRAEPLCDDDAKRKGGNWFRRLLGA